MLFKIIVSIFSLALILIVLAKLMKTVIVYEYQKGLSYKKGKLVEILGPGEYHYFKRSSHIEVVDLRTTQVVLSGQEILTKDNVSLKLTIAGLYQVIDPQKAFHQSTNYMSEFYSLLQIVLRDLVGSFTIDELLESKGDIDRQLLANAQEKADNLGLSLLALSVKDIMLPANLKKAFSGILETKKEAQRQLEKARGEQAVLRSLANSARLYDEHPMLLQARLIQTLSASNNSVVFNSDGKLALVDQN